MKKYKVNYPLLAAGVLLFIVALTFTEIIPGGETLRLVIMTIPPLILVSNFYKKKNK